MGDRCYCWGRVPEKDWPKFKNWTDLGDAHDIGAAEAWPGMRGYEVYDRNYAMWADLEAAAAAGCAFIAFNEAGGDYGACVMVSSGDGTWLRRTVDKEGYVVIRLGEDGVLDPEELADGQAVCRAILAVEKRCREAAKESAQ